MADLLIALLLNAAFWGGMWILAASRATLTWVERVLATAAAGMATIVVSLQLLSISGQINRVSLSAICVGSGLLGLCRRFRSRRSGTDQAVAAQTSRRGLSSWSVAPALAALLLASWAALDYLRLGLLFPVEPVSDAPIYHLYFAIRWWKAGWLQLVPTPFGAEEVMYFPSNGDLWFTWLLTLGPTAPLVKVGQWPFLVCGTVALYGIARSAGAHWPAAILASALWVALPIILTQASLANVDLIWTSFYLTAVYFLVRSFDAPQRDAGGPLILFALACGLVAGTKTVGAVFVLLLLPPAILAIARRPRPLRQLAWLATGMLVPSAYWYARNVWLTGNALYPLQLSLFGHVWAYGWYEAAAMRATAYHVPPAAWHVLVGRLAVIAGVAGFSLVVAGAIAGWVQALRPSLPATARRTLALCSTLAVAQLVIYWAVLPYNTQERFLSAALGLALVPLATATSSHPVLQAGLCLLLGWQLLGSWSGQLGGSLPLLRVYDNPLGLGNPSLALLLPVSLLLAGVILQRGTRFRWMLAAVIVASGSYLPVRPLTKRLSEQPVVAFYPQAGFAASLLPGWHILEEAATPAGSRVAYAGTNLPYYLFGLGLRNDVEYININRDLDGLPHDYHLRLRQRPDFRLADNPWPQWYRTDLSFDAWLANLRRRGIELLFIARENRHGRLEPPGALPQFPIEREWADAHPDLFVDLGPFNYAPGTIPWVRVYRLMPAR